MLNCAQILFLFRVLPFGPIYNELLFETNKTTVLPATGKFAMLEFLPHFERELLTYPYIIQPHWLGSYLHKTHQSNLIRKKPDYYSSKFPNIPDNLPYFWPL